MTMTSYPGVAMISYSQHVHVNMGFLDAQASLAPTQVSLSVRP